jgi:hypothetical protein
MTPLPPFRTHVRAYEVALVDAPGDGRTDVTLGDVSGLGSVHTLLVSPHGGSAWTGVVEVDERGSRGVSGIFGTPSPTWACVLVRGSAFLVDVLDPISSGPIRTDGPVREAVEVVDEGLLLLATAWSITAAGVGTVAWATRRVSIESLQLDRVVDHRLHGVADPEDEARAFTVDLLTGAVDGGSV